jgi:signal transduction histidine kinase
MSLRARFVLLIVGSAVVPPLMLAIVSLFISVGGATPDGGGGFFAMRAMLREIKSGNATVQSVASAMSDSDVREYPVREPLVTILVVGSDGTLRHPAQRAGEPVDALELLGHAPIGETAAFVSIPLPDESGGTGFFAAAYSPEIAIRPVMSVGVVTPIAILVFTAVMSVFIIRSINRSIGRLEAATRRIADGDLDFELDASGVGSLASLTRSFDTMRRRLLEQEDRGARFLMGLSHDLKTPLSSIIGYVDAIRDGHADTAEKLTKYTSIIMAKAGVLQARITALIDYATQETRDWEATLEPVDLAAFLAECAGIAQVDATAKRREFSSRIELPADMQVPMDAGMVTRAFENLLDNAFRYSCEGAAVNLDARVEGGMVVVTVANEGLGIEPDALPMIFEPLYRASRDRNSPGFGLGLATVRSVMISHGWSIEARSVPGSVTAFIVRIPVPANDER